MRFMLKDIMVDIILSVKFPTHEHIELATLAIDMWPIMCQQDAATTRLHDVFVFSLNHCALN